MKKDDKALLVLEDGSSFEGISIGSPGERIGELALNTSVVGYQEMMTDTTNAGKILVLTYPLIGNYGTADKFYESEKVWLGGLVIKEESRIYSNWQAEGPFRDFLKKENVVAIAKVDTRTLAVVLRDSGEMLGAISTAAANKTQLLNAIKKFKAAKSHIKHISTKKTTEIKGQASSAHKIVILDLGMLRGFTKQLQTIGCNITFVPYDTDAEKIIGMKPDGVIISNGPEEDEAIPLVARTVKDLLGKVPMMGIATGHEIIGLSLGASLKRMKVGHHGVNYPVKPPDSNKGEITVQNHSFVIDEESLKARRDVTVTLRNINDDSVEEMESGPLKFISTQYYPASPGFDEVNTAFRRFLKMTNATKVHKEVEDAKT